MEIFDDGGQTARVVVVRMGERDHVELANGAAPKIGRHDVFADIEACSGGAAEGKHPAAVDEHQFGIGKADQQAVALPHIDGGELQFAAMDCGREWMPEDQREEQQDSAQSGQ